MRGRQDSLPEPTAPAGLRPPGVTLSRLLKIYATFAPYLRPYWKSFVLAYGGLAGAVLIGLAKPWPVKFIFDHVLLDRPRPEILGYVTPVPGHDRLALLTFLCVGLVLVFLCEGVLSYASRYVMVAAGENVTNDVRRRVFDHLQLLPHSFHSASRSGDLVVRFTSDILALKTLLIKQVQSFARDALTSLGILATMLWMDWGLTLLALTIVPPLYLLGWRSSRRIHALSKMRRSKEGEVGSLVQETVTSMATVQAFSQEKGERRRFARESGESLKAGVERVRVAQGFSRAVQVITALGTALVVWYGARQALTGELTPGDLIVFMAYLKDLYTPVGKLSELIVDLSSAIVCGERVVEILEAEAAVKDAPGALKAPPFRGEVAYEGVTFGYIPGEPVLKDCSFDVKPGNLVALIGSSGTGKSTVVNLLLRFFDPWQGRILIDGQDLRSFTLKSLRRQMSVVLQEPVLLRRSIRENIAYGKPRARFEEIVAAAEAAQAHDFIMRLPGGYDAVLDERGESLSGGQRQRIALARAILRNAPILILDEPGTGLDAITESRITESLNRLAQGKTTFIIAHRLSTIMKADLILVLEEGKVMEQGTHADLLTRSSLYRRFYHLQQHVHGITRSGEGQGEP